MDPQDLQSSPKPFTRSTIDDKTGLLAAAATSVGAVLYGPAGGPGVTNAYAGQEVTKKAALKRVTSRSLTLTTSGHAGSYKIGAGNPWIITGSVGGVAGVTESLLLTSTDGPETVRSTKLWDDPTTCTVANAGQNDALGTVAAGVGDIGGPLGASLRGYKPHADATVIVKGQDGFSDDANVKAGFVEPTNGERIVALGTTVVGITVYA